tara:strand:- start:89 stop:379 length:291 start_codon:yes stop_codon:yes gene_type:complete
MTRTELILEKHRWMSDDDVLKILIYNHQGAQWIKGLEYRKLEDSMDEFAEAIQSMPRKKVEAFTTYVRDKYFAKRNEDVTKEKFEERWKRASQFLT